jgi:membrane fusion protein, multidrug efflux system
MTKRFRFLLCCALPLLFLSGVSFGEAPTADTPNAVSSAIKVVLFPYREAVISNTVTANVQEYKFKEGERFKEGDVLVRLDDRLYRQTKVKAEAQCAEAKAAQAFAEENLKRNQTLFERSAVGKSEVEQSRLDRENASAKLASAEASVKMAAIDLDACQIKAPFAGRMAKRSVKEHEFVTVGHPVVEILDDSQLLADMHLPAAMRPSVAPADELECKIDETNTVHKGKVYEIGGRIDYESRTFEVKVKIDNKDGKLSAGMSGILLEKGH